ncbi:hypothetical protein LCGC14_1490450 [marine sediment metagenome]|uniref:Uncharacterized protein n=1 Tax=marine sediment metagenome TaxID=412755 RepID=A0A0F9JSU6_9ZZZZ
MRQLEEKDLKDKTIVSADCVNVNRTELTFSDGTTLSIWAEPAIQVPGTGTISGFFVKEIIERETNDSKTNSNVNDVSCAHAGSRSKSK